MKMFAMATAAAISVAGAAFAQPVTTTQAGVLGASDDSVYSLQVQGANGVVYNCKPNPVTVDGNSARVCVRADGASLFEAGAGLGTAAGIGAAVALIGLAAGGGVLVHHHHNDDKLNF